MKKLISKIRKWLCNYHKKRYEKLYAKMIGAKKYYIQDKRDINILLSGIVYADTDSVKNR